MSGSRADKALFIPSISLVLLALNLLTVEPIKASLPGPLISRSSIEFTTAKSLTSTNLPSTSSSSGPKFSAAVISLFILSLCSVSPCLANSCLNSAFLNYAVDFTTLAVR
mgnify:CR=1 FL=1